jgi:hypothetical protein
MTLQLNAEYLMPDGHKIKVVLVNDCRARVKYLDGKVNTINGKSFTTYPESDISPQSELTPITTNTEG